MLLLAFLRENVIYEIGFVLAIGFAVGWCVRVWQARSPGASAFAELSAPEIDADDVRAARRVTVCADIEPVTMARLTAPPARRLPPAQSE